MSIQVETKDCTALGDAELAELADLCVEGPIRYEVGLLSKQAEAWVLITLRLLHPRTHRRHPVCAHRAGLGEAHGQA